jgi:hypothetical protein
MSRQDLDELIRIAEEAVRSFDVRGFRDTTCLRYTPDLMPPPNARPSDFLDATRPYDVT